MKIDELGRREFIAHAAKACFGVGLMPMAGAYIQNTVSALEPASRIPTARHAYILKYGRSHVSFRYIWPQA